MTKIQTTSYVKPLSLKQGGNKCVSSEPAHIVGADLDDVVANAAMLEHSMKIVLLARQANLKVKITSQMSSLARLDNRIAIAKKLLQQLRQ